MEKLECKDGSEYRIYRDSILGKGGFAVVFKGKNVESKEEVAIKEIHKNFDYGHQEIKQMAELSNDSRNNYVVPLLDHYVHEKENIKRLYLVLPYYKHGSLSSYISQKGSLSPKIAAPVFLQIVNGLEYLHKIKGIMHRDLTPGNILIENVFSNKLRVLISDLGMAKKYENNLKMLQTVCGTPGYMPPEFCLGHYTMASEVYSLGGILYFILTEKHPDTGKEEIQIKNVRDEQAADLIKNLWHHKPSRRLSVRAIKSHAFFTGVSLSQSNTGNSEKKPSRRPSSPGCSHRLKDKNDDYCNGCKTFVGSRDSAYASVDQRSKKTNEESRRRTSSRPPSLKERQTNDENAHGESRRRTSSRTPSLKNRQTNDENAIEWPIPSINSIYPEDSKTSLKEIRLIDDKKGRYMITQWNVLVFEALDGDRKYVRYIFEIIVNDSKQKFLIYEPNNDREQLRKLEDDLIHGKILLGEIIHVEGLRDYMYYYKLMVKAVKKFHKRNALLHFSYLNGIRAYTAKLMCDKSFRYIKNGETFLEQEDGSLKSDTGKSKLSEEEKQIFIKYKELMLNLDRSKVEIFGKWYPPVYLNERNEQKLGNPRRI